MAMAVPAPAKTPPQPPRETAGLSERLTQVDRAFVIGLIGGVFSTLVGVSAMVLIAKILS